MGFLSKASSAISNVLTSRLIVHKAMLYSDKLLGNRPVESDYIMIIGGFEPLMFFVKTSALPMPQHEDVKITTNRGVKTSIVGYIQTLNSIDVEFDERDSLIAKVMIETILLEGKNGSLDVKFFQVGEQIIDSQIWGYVKNANISISDSISVSNENTNGTIALKVTINGHYIPNIATRAIALGKLSYDVLTSPTMKKLL